MLTLWTEQPIGISRSIKGFPVFMGKTVVDNRVWQVAAVEELLVTIGNHGCLGCPPYPREDFIVGGVGFALTDHLVTKNVGKDEGHRFNNLGSPHHVVLVNLEDCEPLSVGAGGRNKGRNDSLLHVRAGRVS